MGIKSGSLLLLLLCTVLCWVIELHDLYSSIQQSTLEFLFVTFRSLAQATSCRAQIISPERNSSSNEIINIYGDDGRMLIRGEVEVVMEKLGLCYSSPNGGDDKFEENIATLFYENEPSVEEVKQAFDVYDENCDGYIDEKEFDKVLCKLGLTQFSQRECQRMIAAYDRNGDRRIDFAEFSKLVEDSFCC